MLKIPQNDRNISQYPQHEWNIPQPPTWLQYFTSWTSLCGLFVPMIVWAVFSCHHSLYSYHHLWYSYHHLWYFYHLSLFGMFLSPLGWSYHHLECYYPYLGRHNNIWDVPIRRKCNMISLVPDMEPNFWESVCDIMANIPKAFLPPLFKFFKSDL
jgi:hypothetical protein